MKSASVALCLATVVCLAGGPGRGEEGRPADLEKMVGQPADIAPSAYQWRADRPPRENPPESWIALMKCAGLPFDKPVDVGAPALQNVLCGLLWEEVRPVRRVEIAWSADRRRRPEPGDLAVTFFDAEAKGIPTWWNSAVLREAGKPEVSADGRVYTYTIPVDTFGLVVSVRGRRGASAFEVPLVRAFTSEVWKMMDLEIEWGFDKAAAGLDYSGRIEAYDGIPGRIRPLAGDAGTTVSGPRRVALAAARRWPPGAEPEFVVPRRVENGGRSGPTTATGTMLRARSLRFGPARETSPSWRRTWRRGRFLRRSTASLSARRASRERKRPGTRRSRRSISRRFR